ncbi:hypothetical protein [Rhabdochromatium marinum]|uniref:hypothetical protein n=1 Tax=Rhabdochromatium marinum TaxID=48729 RepID=UPI001907230A|nr:hypothetical protein [Rhabdochromatium marinum]MBK1647121.1 hypothetical protein [Rhabdochromatium marinum]
MHSRLESQPSADSWPVATIRKRNRQPSRPWWLAIATLLSLSASAQDWYLQSQASLDSFYDDNVRLTSIDAQSSMGAIVRAETKFGRRTEAEEIAINSGISSRRYTGVSELDRTDGFLGLNAAYQLERSRFDLDMRIDYDSTLTSEVETSGFVQTNKRRTRISAAPSWTYSLSNRASLAFGTRYTDVSYEDVGLIPLYNYQMTSSNLNGTYLWSERMQLFSRLTFDHYEADEVGTSSDTIGLLAGGAYAISERLSLTAMLGPRFATVETPTPFGSSENQDSTGMLVDISIEQRFNVGKLGLSGSQALLPSSSGDLVSTTSAGLALDYPFDSRWSLLLNANAYRNRNPGGEEDINDRDYVAVEPRLRHKLGDWWALDLGYRARYQKYTEQQESALSNAVFLNLDYTPAAH